MTMRLWLFDFDGTLSPLVNDRNAAVMHSGCMKLLKTMAKEPAEFVAVISSRKLDDIVSRVPLDDVIIGGSSGIEWRLPGGCRISLGASKEDLLAQQREEILPLLENVSSRFDIEIEDKCWSIAIHVKKTSEIDAKQLRQLLEDELHQKDLTIFNGPDVLELQFLPKFNKSIGASFLAGLLKIDTNVDSIVYAGDDENDAVAMWWTLLTGGTAIMVGSEIDVPGALCVKDQKGLVALVKSIHGND